MRTTSPRPEGLGFIRLPMRRTLISEVSTALELMVQIPLLRKEADGLGQKAPFPPKSDENESRHKQRSVISGKVMAYRRAWEKP